MPKLRKQATAKIDVDEMEAAEYSEGSYAKYDGEVPPADTILTAYIKSMWWAETQNGDPMLKVLVVAEGNEGEEEEYEGLPMWENMALTPAAKFKWAPFFDHFGITVADAKNKVIVSGEDDQLGEPVTKIGSFVPGSDESWCRVITSREPYNGNWQAHVAEWLDYEEPEEDAEEEEPEEPEDEEAEDEDTEEEPEEEPEEAPAARGRRSASKGRTTPTPTATRSTPSRSARSRSAPAKAGKSPAPAKRGRRAAGGSSDDPPF